MPSERGYSIRPDAPIIDRVSPVDGFADRLEVFFSLGEYSGPESSISRVEVHFNGEMRHTDSPTSGSLVITGLTAGREYEFRAYSRNYAGLSNGSNIVSGMVPLTVGTSVPALAGNELERRFRYGRTGHICNTVVKSRPPMNDLRLHMTHDLNLPTDMTGEEFGTLEIPAFENAVLPKKETNAFFIHNGVAVVTNTLTTFITTHQTGPNGDAGVNPIYRYNAPIVKSVFTETSVAPKLQVVRPFMYNAGTEEGTIYRLRLNLIDKDRPSGGARGPQLSLPITKWRLVLRFDNDDSKTFAISIGADTEEPYLWEATDIAGWPSGLTAAFRRMQVAVKAGNTPESLTVALVDTTPSLWKYGETWHKAFEINSTLNGVKASRLVEGLAIGSPISTDDGEITTTLNRLTAPNGLFAGSPSNPEILSVRIRPISDNSRIYVDLSNTSAEDVSSFTFVLYVNERLFAFPGGAANSAALSNSIQFRHGVNPNWDDFVDNGNLEIDDIERAPTAITIGLAVVETNAWQLENDWEKAFLIGKTLTAEDFVPAIPINDLIDVVSVRFGTGPTLKKVLGMPVAGKEYSYHSPSKTLLLNKNDVSSLSTAIVTVAYRESNNPFITIPAASLAIPAFSRNVAGITPPDKEISVTVCYNADPTARATWKTPTSWRRNISGTLANAEDPQTETTETTVFQFLGIDPADGWRIQEQRRLYSENEAEDGAEGGGAEGEWANAVPSSSAETDLVPLPPPIVEVRSLVPTKLFVSWRETPSPGSSPVYAYRLRYRQGDSPWVSRDYSRNVLQDNVSNLIPDRIYEFQVQAINSNGASDWSESVFQRIAVGDVPDKPNAPIANVFGNISNFDQEFRTGDFDVEVEWTAPNDNGFVILEHQLLRFQPGTNTKPYVKHSIGIGEPLRCVFTYDNSAVDDGYKYKVRARNIIGWGEWSDWGFAGGFDTAFPVLESEYKTTFVYGIYAVRGGDGSENPPTFTAQSIVFLNAGGLPLRHPYNISRKARMLRIGPGMYGHHIKVKTGDDLISYVENTISTEIQDRITEVSRKLADAETEYRIAQTQKYLAATFRVPDVREPIASNSRKSFPFLDADVPNGAKVDITDVLNVEKNGESYQRVDLSISLNSSNQYWFDDTTKTVLFHASATVSGADITFRHRAEPASGDTVGEEILTTNRTRINATKATMDELRRELSELQSGRMEPRVPLVLTWEFAKDRSVTWQVAYFDISNADNQRRWNNYVLVVFAETNESEGSYRATNNVESTSLVLQERNVTSSDSSWNLLESYYGGTLYAGATSKQGGIFRFPYRPANKENPLWLTVLKSIGGYSNFKLRPFGNAPISYTITAEGYDLPSSVDSTFLVTVYQGDSASRSYWGRSFSSPQKRQYQVAANERVFFNSGDIGETVNIEYAERLRIMDGNIVEVSAVTGSAQTEQITADGVFPIHSNSGASFDDDPQVTAGDVTADGNWHFTGTTLTYWTDTAGTISVVYTYDGKAAVSYREDDQEIIIALNDRSAYHHVITTHRIRFDTLENFLDSNLTIASKS